MTFSERRRAQRIAGGDRGSVLLRLHVGDDGQEIVRAADVSSSGIGLQSTMAMPAGTPVELAFNNGECEITATGRITWCSRASDQSESQEGEFFRLGVSFDGKASQAHTLFYLAVKQQIVRDED